MGKVAILLFIVCIVFTVGCTGQSEPITASPSPTGSGLATTTVLPTDEPTIESSATPEAEPASPTPAETPTASPQAPDVGAPATAEITPTTMSRLTPTVSIEAPAMWAELDLSQPITVSGRGGALFEGNVVVQVLDNSGEVLIEEPTILVGEDVGLGGAGPWEVTLSLGDVAAGTPGIIYAYSTSAEDGSIVAADSVNVFYGPKPEGPWVSMDHPMPYAILASDTFTVTGRGAGLFEGALVVEAVDGEGNVLDQAPTILVGEEVGTGAEGEWTVELMADVEPGTEGQLEAWVGSPEDGSVVASFVVNVVFGRGE